MQPGGKGLLQTHQKIPRPELSPVGVAGKLQVKSRIRRVLRAARLVREQHADQRVIRRAGNGSLRAAAMRGIDEPWKGRSNEIRKRQ